MKMDFFKIMKVMNSLRILSLLNVLNTSHKLLMRDQEKDSITSCQLNAKQVGALQREIESKIVYTKFFVLNLMYFIL